MALPYKPLTELEAVNIMLRAINEQPIDSIATSGLTSVYVATQLLHEVSREVQSAGLYCNSEEDLEFPIDTNGYIYLPSNTLKIDPSDASVTALQRGNRLYDKENHTYVFTRGIKCNIVYFLEFEDLPNAVRNYITARAAKKFQNAMFGADYVDAKLAEEELAAKITFLNEEIDTSDCNIRSDPYLNNIVARRV